MRLETKQDFPGLDVFRSESFKTTVQRGRSQSASGRQQVTYPEVSIEMEAFSRPLWALVPFWKGGGDGFEELYQKGLKNGTDPDHPEYWGGFYGLRPAVRGNGGHRERNDLYAGKGLGTTWRGGQNHLADWLYGINGHIIPDCNWRFL